MCNNWPNINSSISFQDFIYLGQVNVNQDSLPSFLKIAERLKIKGLCESLSPVTIPAMGMHQRKEMMMGEATTPPPNVTHGNFENLLPRSPYVQTEPIVSMTQQVRRTNRWEHYLASL